MEIKKQLFKAIYEDNKEEASKAFSEAIKDVIAEKIELREQSLIEKREGLSIEPILEEVKADKELTEAFAEVSFYLSELDKSELTEEDKKEIEDLIEEVGMDTVTFLYEAGDAVGGGEYNDAHTPFVSSTAKKKSTGGGLKAAGRNVKKGVSKIGGKIGGWFEKRRQKKLVRGAGGAVGSLLASKIAKSPEEKARHADEAAKKIQDTASKVKIDDVLGAVGKGTKMAGQLNKKYKIGATLKAGGGKMGGLLKAGVQKFQNKAK